MCSRYHRSRVKNTNASLPLVVASWLVLSAYQWARLYRSRIVPISFGFAILRYRLYNIDIIIRRTLIYSTLTVLLAAVYAVSIFTLQSLIGGLVQGNQLEIFASTLPIGLLFKPLHDRTRALIDSRFY